MKKGAVDIAIMIGAIVIPVAALIGALILSFSMIERLTQGVIVAHVIAYDISALAAVAYSVPEDISIRYNPAFDCENVFIDDVTQQQEFYLSCLNDEMQIRKIRIVHGSESTRTFRHPRDTNLKYFNLITFEINIPDERPIPAELHAHGSLKETSPIHFSDEEIIIEKTRGSFFDTLDRFANTKNPLFEIVDLVNSVCNNEYEGIGSFQSPPSYYICHEGSTIYFKKYIHLPHQVTPPYSSDGAAPQGDSLENFGKVIVLQSFDFDKISCAVEIEGIGCNDLENEDILKIGYDSVETRYKSEDVVRHGMGIDYSASYSNEEVTLILERTR